MRLLSPRGALPLHLPAPIAIPLTEVFLDSVLRGYPIPLIYLHHISKQVAGHKREDFEVIDGQQRITALYEYKDTLCNTLSSGAGFPDLPIPTP